MVEISILDNGKGFAAGERASFRGGNGLLNMKDRVELWGGTFSVEGMTGQGTRVMLCLPLADLEA